MIGQNNVTHMLVGKNLDLATSKTKSALTTGELGVFEVGSQTSLATVAALTAGKRVTIATKNSKGVIVESPVIEYSKISSKSKQAYAAPTQRKRAIGFDGTSGTIDAIDSANYVAHIFWEDNSCTFAQGTPVKFAAYPASANATQAEIAAGLTNNFNKNFRRENPKLIKAEVLINNAGAAITGTGALTVVYGSKYVSAATDGDAVVAIGDYLRIGTATTSPCYKITAVTGGVGGIITLDTPYQSASATIAEASAEYVAKATAATSDAGVLLTALELTEGFEPGVIRYDFLEFDLQLGSEVGSTSTSSVATPSLGSGTYYDVAQTEWFLKGNRGEAWREGGYPKPVTLESTPGKTYTLQTVGFVNGNARTIDRTVESYGTVMIALESSAGAYASLNTIFGI